MDNLQKTTKEYWRTYDHTNIDRSLERYIRKEIDGLNGQSLLEAELDTARKTGRITTQSCKTLVLMVGYSLEPLLQSVCVYQPQKIILLLNQEGYGEEEWCVFANHLVEAIDHLKTKKLLETDVQIPGKNKHQGYPVEDNPRSVFQKLVAVLQNENDMDGVVIDVTGGKKSTVSGAYLYAAYAGTRISYVDFDEYDPKHRRPYGYSCKIGGLSNPYQSFALREWERVRGLYGRYQFREAIRVLNEEILPAVEKWQSNAKASVQQMVAFLAFYEKWDSGDLREAHAALINLPEFNQPDAVTILGPAWYGFSDGKFTKMPKHFYGKKEWVKGYACDELARIQRLIECNEDYRSALLRAGSLNEVVMLTRMVHLVNAQQEQNQLLDALDENAPGAYNIFDKLLKPEGEKLTISKDKYNRVRFGPRQFTLATIEIRAPMNHWWYSTKLFNDRDNGWKQFLKTRNKLAHTYFSVPREWAEDALAFVKANIEDFWGQSVGGMGVHTEALPWAELCALTGVSQFLPPNLRKETSL